MCAGIIRPTQSILVTFPIAGFFVRFEGNSILSLTPKLDFFPHESRFFGNFAQRLRHKIRFLGKIVWGDRWPFYAIFMTQIKVEMKNVCFFINLKDHLTQNYKKETMKLVLRTPKFLCPTFSLQGLGTKFRTKKHAIGDQVCNQFKWSIYGWLLDWPCIWVCCH